MSDFCQKHGRVIFDGLCVACAVEAERDKAIAERDSASGRERQTIEREQRLERRLATAQALASSQSVTIACLWSALKQIERVSLSAPRGEFGSRDKDTLAICMSALRAPSPRAAVLLAVVEAAREHDAALRAQEAFDCPHYEPPCACAQVGRNLDNRVAGSAAALRAALAADDRAALLGCAP